MNSLKIWFVMIRAKLTTLALVFSDKNFSQYPVNMRWG